MVKQNTQSRQLVMSPTTITSRGLPGGAASFLVGRPRLAHERLHAGALERLADALALAEHGVAGDRELRAARLLARGHRALDRRRAFVQGEPVRVEPQLAAPRPRVPHRRPDLGRTLLARRALARLLPSGRRGLGAAIDTRMAFIAGTVAASGPARTETETAAA